MYRHRNIVAERVVIEHINAEEQDNVNQPAPDGDFVRLEEEWRALRVEL
jgi:hypothetical protein